MQASREDPTEEGQNAAITANNIQRDSAKWSGRPHPGRPWMKYHILGGQQPTESYSKLNMDVNGLSMLASSVPVAAPVAQLQVNTQLQQQIPHIVAQQLQLSTGGHQHNSAVADHSTARSVDVMQYNNVHNTNMQTSSGGNGLKRTFEAAGHASAGIRAPPSSAVKQQQITNNGNLTLPLASLPAGLSAVSAAQSQAVLPSGGNAATKPALQGAIQGAIQQMLSEAGFNVPPLARLAKPASAAAAALQTATAAPRPQPQTPIAQAQVQRPSALPLLPAQPPPKPAKPAAGLQSAQQQLWQLLQLLSQVPAGAKPAAAKPAAAQAAPVAELKATAVAAADQPQAVLPIVERLGRLLVEIHKQRREKQQHKDQQQQQHELEASPARGVTAGIKRAASSRKGELCALPKAKVRKVAPHANTGEDPFSAATTVVAHAADAAAQAAVTAAEAAATMIPEEHCALLQAAASNGRSVSPRSTAVALTPGHDAAAEAAATMIPAEHCAALQAASRGTSLGAVTLHSVPAHDATAAAATIRQPKPPVSELPFGMRVPFLRATGYLLPLDQLQLQQQLAQQQVWSPDLAVPEGSTYQQYSRGGSSTAAGMLKKKTPAALGRPPRSVKPAAVAAYMTEDGRRVGWEDRSYSAGTDRNRVWEEHKLVVRVLSAALTDFPESLAAAKSATEVFQARSCVVCWKARPISGSWCCTKPSCYKSGAGDSADDDDTVKKNWAVVKEMVAQIKQEASAKPATPPVVADAPAEEQHSTARSDGAAAGSVAAGPAITAAAMTVEAAGSAGAANTEVAVLHSKEAGGPSQQEDVAAASSGLPALCHGAAAAGPSVAATAGAIEAPTNSGSTDSKGGSTAPAAATANGAIAAATGRQEDVVMADADDATAASRAHGSAAADGKADGTAAYSTVVVDTAAASETVNPGVAVTAATTAACEVAAVPAVVTRTAPASTYSGSVAVVPDTAAVVVVVAGHLTDQQEDKQLSTVADVSLKSAAGEAVDACVPSNTAAAAVLALNDSPAAAAAVAAVSPTRPGPTSSTTAGEAGSPSAGSPNACEPAATAAEHSRPAVSLPAAASAPAALDTATGRASLVPAANYVLPVKEYRYPDLRRLWQEHQLHLKVILLELQQRDPCALAMAQQTIDGMFHRTCIRCFNEGEGRARVSNGSWFCATCVRMYGKAHVVTDLEGLHALRHHVSVDPNYKRNNSKAH